jgi:group I intron endonuclease
MIKSGIYKITAIHNGEFYIGSSKDIRVRWNRHACDFRKNEHGNKRMQNIYNKYGQNCFKFEIVEEIIFTNKENLIELEQKYLDNLNPALNSRKLADANIGLKHTDEAKEKMRQAKLGKKLSDAHKQSLSKASSGRKSAKHTEETKNAIAKNKAKLTDEQVWQMKWLNWLNLSSWEIARQFGIVNTTVHRIVNNKKRAYIHVDFNHSVPKLH